LVILADIFHDIMPFIDLKFSNLSKNTKKSPQLAQPEPGDRIFCGLQKSPSFLKIRVKKTQLFYFDNVHFAKTAENPETCKIMFLLTLSDFSTE
jgi:hypothetical protein